MMEIDIMQYVDDLDIKDAILSGLQKYASDNAERIIANAGYHLAENIANAHLGEDAGETIAAKCADVIASLSCFTLFSDGGYGREPSRARRLLDQVVAEQREEVTKAVRAAIHNLSKRDVIDIIKSGKVKMVVE